MDYAKLCQKLEAALSTHHADLATLEARLSEPELYEPQAKETLQTLLKEQAHFKNEIQSLEEQLLEAMLALEV